MLNKIKALKKRHSLNKILKKYDKSIKIDDSTILKDSFSIDIRNGLKENISQVNVGRNNILACKFILEKGSGYINVGNDVYIGAGTKLISINGIDIGDYVTISWGCTIYDHNSHSIYFEERINDTKQLIKDLKTSGNEIKNKDWSNVISKSIKISDRAWIGFDCVILKGVTIGEGAVVAARSVVVKDVLPYTVVGGNPATILKKIDRTKGI